MSMEWQDELSDFMESATWIKAPGLENEEPLGCYLWEDFKATGKFQDANPTVNIFTLVEGDMMVLVKGIYFVNRFAYLLTFDEVSLPEGKEELIWWKDEDNESS